MLRHIYDVAENFEIKIIVAKTEKGRIAFETVKLKTIEELHPHPFRK
jgi:hypothetical protein